MQNYEMVIIIIVALCIIWIIWGGVKGYRKGGVLPEPSAYPEYHGEHIERIKPTIETQYGRDLMTASIEIYKSDANLSAEGATFQASSLVDEVYKDCAEIDKENAERVSEAFKNIDKSDLRPLNTDEREWLKDYCKVKP